MSKCIQIEIFIEKAVEEAYRGVLLKTIDMHWYVKMYTNRNFIENAVEEAYRGEILKTI